jgi:hypothetical protein
LHPKGLLGGATEAPKVSLFHGAKYSGFALKCQVLCWEISIDAISHIDGSVVFKESYETANTPCKLGSARLALREGVTATSVPLKLLNNSVVDG